MSLHLPYPTMCALGALLISIACGWAGELHDFGAVREVQFPAGFKVLDAKGAVVKTLPESRSANARGYEVRQGTRWYVSDYSWEQLQKGKSPHYMVALEDAAKSMFDIKAAREFSLSEPEYRRRVQTVLFPEGYVVLNLQGEVVKEVPGSQVVNAAAWIETEQGWLGNVRIHQCVFISDYSWQSYKQGKPAYVMAAAGTSRAIGHLEDITNFQLHRDWKSYVTAVKVALPYLKRGVKFEWCEELRTPGRIGLYPWFECLADGSIPQNEAMEVLRQLADHGLSLSPAVFLQKGNLQSLPRDVFRQEQGDSEGGYPDMETFLKSVEETEQAGIFRQSKTLLRLGLGYLAANAPEQAHKVFEARWRWLSKNPEPEERWFTGNTGDNTIPNAAGYYLYSRGLLGRDTRDELVDMWIRSHLRLTLAQQLGLSSTGGENNFDAEDFTVFPYQNILSTISSPRQAAAIVLSAKGVRQQFQLATGAQKMGDYFYEETWDVDGLTALRRFGIKPWNDSQYALIDEGTVCLDYVRLRNPNPFLPHASTYLCLAYDRNGVRAMWRVRDLEKTEDRLSQLIAMASAGVGGADFEHRYRAECDWLLNTFVRPGLKGSGRVERLLISPDGMLNFIPFAGMLDADGRLLVDKYEIACVPTYRLLFDPAGVRTGGPVQAAMVLGDPDFNDATPLSPTKASQAGTRFLSRNTQRFPRLPGTAHEIDGLATQLKSSGWNTRVLSGAKADEINLVLGCQAPALLHFATHAYYWPEFKPGELLHGGVKLGGDYTSGITLAGANTTMMAWEKGHMPAPESDGILCPEELSRLNLKGCELITLSACQTAQGRVLDGEGVQGLSLAAATAGARNLITTLWPVADDPTADLMTDFYKRYLKGASAQASLNQVQREHFARWRSEKGLATALSFVAPFICTTVEPFKAVQPLAADSLAAKLDLPKPAPGKSGYVATLDRSCKVWCPSYRADAAWVWVPENGMADEFNVDADGGAIGEGKLVMVVGTRALSCMKGLMAGGKFEGEVNVEVYDPASRDPSSPTKVDEYRELWRNGTCVGRLPTR